MTVSLQKAFKTLWKTRGIQGHAPVQLSAKIRSQQTYRATGYLTSPSGHKHSLLLHKYDNVQFLDKEM